MITRIELSIDELVLHDVVPGDHDRVAGAVRHELARLLAAPDLPGGLVEGGDAARLDAGAFRIAPRAEAATIGGQVAQALFGALSR